MQILIPILFLIFCFCLGSLPLTNLIVKNLANINLTKVGTGNASVAAAFVHAPKLVGIFAVLAEISRGITPVLVAKLLFPEIPTWQLVGLIFLVAGRYFIAQGGGVTNACWGVLVYSPTVAFGSGITGFLILVIGKQVFPQKNQKIRQWSTRLGCLSGFLWVLLFHTSPSLFEFLAAAVLAIFLVVINFRQSDDMVLQKQLKFSLDSQLNPKFCGEKAARLAILKISGFNVPKGFVLPVIENGNRELVAGSKTKKSIPDSSPLSNFLSVDKILDNLDKMSLSFPLIVRSSAVGEDSDNSSAAGQYETIYPVNNETELFNAINICHQSYWLPKAIAYRRQREIPDVEMAVLIQPYIMSKVAGVMFTRNPLDGSSKIIIEALPGGAAKVVGGRLTPVHLEIDKNRFHESQNSKVKGKNNPNFKESSDFFSQLENQDILPLEIIQELVNQAEAIEKFFHGLPQDIEWCWDGEKIWILQSRPITNLRPIWTRTIAAEVIPGAIRPLTWSINRPLTCGVWGEIFTIVLGKKVAKLDFTETATLLGSHAYFNATLLGEIFRMMGLPEQGLEFLLRGQKMGKPPLGKVWSALPGLWHLIQKEMAVDYEFERDYNQIFVPALQSLDNNFKQNLQQNSPQSLLELLAQVQKIQEWLKPITYYNILGPIGLGIRRSLFGISEEWLPTDTAPEIVSIRELQKLAVKLKMATKYNVNIEAEFEKNQELQWKFQQWLESYGYLSEVGTDIAVETWAEKPDNFRELLFAMARKEEREKDNFSVKSLNFWQRWQLGQCAKRARTKGKIAEVYGKLLAYLRRTFLAIENYGLEAEIFEQKGDIFYLEFAEVRQWILSTVGWVEEQNPKNSVGVEEKNRREFNIVTPNIEDEQSPLNTFNISPTPPLPYSSKLLLPDQKEIFNKNSLLRELIHQRQEQWEKDVERLVPSVVYGNVLPQESQETISTEENVLILQGIPGSIGCVEGYVKVCRTLEVNLPEEENLIIVVPYTDAGWAPLLLKAKGIIAEVGGQLSHGAIIAREYGIPAVMNISRATTRLKDGQKVKVDGYRGIVELLSGLT